jgi:hypothetical protein
MVKLYIALQLTGYGTAGYALFILAYAGLEVCSRITDLRSIAN